MRDIFLIDFENVASEGLTGITNLTEEDEVVIFYSANSNRLSMKMHILMAKSVCRLTYFEVSVGGKNALDHQISTYVGYLIGTEAADRNYYIVSKDNGYRHIVNFWANHDTKHKVRCIESIKGLSKFDHAVVKEETEKPAEMETKLPEEAAKVQLAERPAETAAEAVAAVDAEKQNERHSRNVRNGRRPLRNQYGNWRNGNETERNDRTETTLESQGRTDRQEYRTVQNNGKSFVVFDNTAKAETPRKTAEQSRTASMNSPQAAGTAGKRVPETAKNDPEDGLETESRKGKTDYRVFEAKPTEQKKTVGDDTPTGKARENIAAVSSEEFEPGKAEEKKAEDKAAEAPKTVQEEKKPELKVPEEQRTGDKKQENQSSEGRKNRARKNGRNEERKETKVKNEKKPGSGTRSDKEQNTQTKPQENRNGRNYDQILPLIAPYPELKADDLKELIAANKKQVLCNTLRKKLGQEKGLALYNQIKAAVWH